MNLLFVINNGVKVGVSDKKAQKSTHTDRFIVNQKSNRYDLILKV